MKRVLLLSSNLTAEPYPVYPLGMGVVAAALARDGYQVEQFDMLAGPGDRLEEVIRGFAPDYVGISIRNLDTCDSLTVTGYPADVQRLVTRIRAVTGAPVIIGGPAFSIMPEELLVLTGADHGIIGEGEQQLSRLLRDLDAGLQPPAILRSGSLLSSEAVGGPLLHDDLVRFYREKSGMINLQTKRGCPHGCIYCSYPALEGKSYRCREAGEVADELERIRRDHGADCFFFTDSVFNDAGGNYLELARELIRRNLGIRWCCYLRPQGTGREELALLKRAGLYAVEVGTDGASDETLSGLGKGFLFEEALAVNDACVAEEIPCAHFIMFGGPGETEATVASGLANIRRLEHSVVFAFSGIRILPGTELHGQAIREGMIAPEDSLLEPAYYISPDVRAEEMNREIALAFRGRRDRIFPPSEGQKRLAVMHRFGFRGLLWDTLIPFRRTGTSQ